MNENNTKSIEIVSNEQEIKRKINQMCDQYVQIVDGETKNSLTKKEIILNLADLYNQLYEMGKYLLPIRSICSTIIEDLEKKGLKINKHIMDLSYVYKVIKANAPQYLTENVLLEDSCDVTLADPNVRNSKDLQILNQNISNDIEEISTYNKKLFSNDIIQDGTPKMDDTSAEFIDEAKRRNINVLKDYSIVPEYQSDSVDPFKDKIETDKPEPRPHNILATALEELSKATTEEAKLILAVSKKTEQFPFSIDSDEERKLELELAEFIRQEAEYVRLKGQIWKPMSDMKFKRAFSEWFDIDKSESDYGVHAASSKNPGEGWFRNPDTGELVRVKRNLTKEHIDDKLPKIRNMKILLKSLVPVATRMEKWYMMKMKNWVIGESYKLSSKLSDRKYK